MWLAANLNSHEHEIGLKLMASGRPWTTVKISRSRFSLMLLDLKEKAHTAKVAESYRSLGFSVGFWSDVSTSMHYTGSITPCHSGLCSALHKELFMCLM